MRFIGPHVSAAGEPAAAVANALAVGATGFALFVKNQRQWVGKPLAEGEVARFKEALAAAPYAPGQVLPHAGYLINLANPDEEKHAKSLASMLDEVRRCETLGLDRVNVHPGSHLNQISPEAACDRVAESINKVLAETQGVTVVIENTAGQGAYLGADPEQLGRIVAGVEDKTRIGICLDTAHAYGAGFDLASEAGLQDFFEQVDKAVGLRYLRGMHLNDSKEPLASHHDRHESLGKGYLGWAPFLAIARDPRFENIPLILETPDDTLWPEETKRLLDA